MNLAPPRLWDGWRERQRGGDDGSLFSYVLLLAAGQNIAQILHTILVATSYRL
jgi:hypothetical protein